MKSTKGLAGVDWLGNKRAAGKASATAKVGVAGYGEGGLIARMKPGRQAHLTRGCQRDFNPGKKRNDEPSTGKSGVIERIWRRRDCVTDRAGGGLIVEYCDEPAVDGPTPVNGG